MTEREGERPFPHTAFAWLVVLGIWSLYQLAGALLAQSIGIDEKDPSLALLQGSVQLGFMFVPALLAMRMSPLGYGHLLRLRTARISTEHWVLVGLGLIMTQCFDIGWTSLQHNVLPQWILDMFRQIDQLQEGMIGTIMGQADWISIMRSVLVVALIPALSEEVLFRGLMQRSLEESSGALTALVHTCMFFSLAHMNPEHLFSLLYISVFLAMLALRARSLVPGIVLHFANNLIAVLGYYASGANPASTQDFLPMVYAAPLVLISTAFLVIALRRSYHSGDFAAQSPQGATGAQA